MAKQRTRTTTGGDQTTGRTTDPGTGAQTTSPGISESDTQRESRQRSQGASATEQAKEKARELASDVKEKASDTVRSGVSSGKTRAADTIGSVAQSLLVSSQHLRDGGQQGASRIVERAATRVDRFANYLQNSSPGEMADRVESFARREPALFLGALFTAGFVGARFLKSSRRDLREDQWQSLGSGGQPARAEGEQPYFGGYPESSSVADREVPIERPFAGADTTRSREAGSSDVSETLVERRVIIPTNEGGRAPNTDFPAVPEDPQRREPY